jgi:hypothetical protein
LPAELEGKATWIEYIEPDTSVNWLPDAPGCQSCVIETAFTSANCPAICSPCGVILCPDISTVNVIVICEKQPSLIAKKIINNDGLNFMTLHAKLV